MTVNRKATWHPDDRDLPLEERRIVVYASDQDDDLHGLDWEPPWSEKAGDQRLNSIRGWMASPNTSQRVER